MEQVQFDEVQQINPANTNRQNKASSLTRMIFKLGLAKDQKQANGVMVVLSITCLLLMMYFIISSFFPSLLDFNKPKKATTPTSVQQRIDAMRNRTLPTPNQQ